MKQECRAFDIVFLRPRSIHPQGWVPIETIPLGVYGAVRTLVAFTPKGGCPLKLGNSTKTANLSLSSIHPQGWVPIETGAGSLAERSFGGE